ncbi:hypothetical protein AOQ84DRAFT_367928 [Glonium stellatum]|uniref:Fork-head domain-containing protein n=1 Tax=Glonium stellatum TaxID=574774 RepID=A0A8E2ESC3_9PEZI|nr:hypothetical protein AOQ84DRAFT_367928 [Glonium stellatum]
MIRAARRVLIELSALTFIWAFANPALNKHSELKLRQSLLIVNLLEPAFNQRSWSNHKFEPQFFSAGSRNEMQELRLGTSFQVGSPATLRLAGVGPRPTMWSIRGTELDSRIPRFSGLSAGGPPTRFQRALRIYQISLAGSPTCEMPLRMELMKRFDKGIRPKFKLEELIALAILTTPNRTANRKYIYKWICNEFPYFADEVITESFEWYNPFSQNIRRFGDELFDALDKQEKLYDIDFKLNAMPNQSENSWTLPPGHEDIIFDRWCYPNRPPANGRSDARLVNLPVELKVKILRSVLRLPAEHWIVLEELRLGHQGFTISISTSNPELKRTGRLPGTTKLCAPFLVNREFHCLGTEIFYGENQFICRNSREAARFPNIAGHFLETIGLRNRQFIRAFNFEFVINRVVKAREMRATIQYLGQSRRLRKLHMQVVERNLPKHYQRDIRKTYGYTELCAFRGLEEFGVSGNCTKTRIFLGDRLLGQKTHFYAPAYEPAPKPKARTAMAP